MRSSGLFRTSTSRAVGLAIPIVIALGAGCGAGFFNPAFINTLSGGQFPVTPGPSAAFILVRALNETGEIVEFFVTIEREELVLDDDGNFILDDQNQFITRPSRETVRVLTGANGLATDIGVLFPCGESPVTMVGLGENLLPTDRHIAIGGGGAGGATGVGVTVQGLNALTLANSNFNCGDTIIYRAFRKEGVPGGVRIETFLLPGSEQPSVFTGANTFANLEELLETDLSTEQP